MGLSLGQAAIARNRKPLTQEIPAKSAGHQALRVLYVGSGSRPLIRRLRERDYMSIYIHTAENAQKWLSSIGTAQSWINKLEEANDELPDAIICDMNLPGQSSLELIRFIRSHAQLHIIPCILLGEQIGFAEKRLALEAGADEIFSKSVETAKISRRLSFLRVHKKEMIRLQVEESPPPIFNIPLWKRALDIFIASAVLLLLSPLMILISLLIKLESHGPILYVSRRAGAGYRVFPFYKFRSMRQGAEAELEKLIHLNQYGQQDKSFVKLTNDPRITRIGRFLRATSLDELPQMFNVLRGDMSLVGNRPLPLYEAERLTADYWAKRFLAPAGITGLWQVTWRNKHRNMCPEERKRLDVEYAEKASIWLDLKILLLTVPALFRAGSE